MAWNEKDRSRGDEELLQGENDRLMEDLASKVTHLNHIAVDLRDEAKDQVNMVDDSAGVFEMASALLGNSFKRVQGMKRLRGQNCKLTCYFTLFVIVFLFVVYLLLDKVMS